MAQQFDIVGNLLLKVDGAEVGVNKLRNSLSKLKLPNNIDSDLKKSFSNLDGLFSKYKSQLQNGFKTKADVSGFTKTAKEINAEYDKITKKIGQLNNTNVSFNIKNDSIVAAEKSLNKLLETQKQLTQNTKNSIEKDLAAITKAGSRSTTVKDISGQLSTAINTGDMQKAVELAQQLKTKMIELKSAQTSWAKSGSTISLSDTLDKIVVACQKGAQGFDGLEKETKEAAQVLANLQAGDLEKINQLLDGMSGDWDRSTSAMKAASGEMEAYANSAQSAVQQVKDLQQSTQYFFSLRNMINLLKRGIREAVDVVKELDAAMTETAVVTDFSVGDMWQKLPEYTANANALGASVKDMYEATTLYYQQGLRTEAAMGIANETMKMARIGGLEAADATDKMTAALRGFNMEINETSAQRVNDVYSNLAAKTASDTEELGTAMQRTASIAASAGMSFEGTAAFLAQAIETTREPAENLGTAMKTIVARFTELKKNPLEITEVDGEEVSYNKVDTALQSIGVSLKDANGQFRDLDKVFLDISKRWDSLTQTQQRYVATTAAGSRQQSRFIAMMSNYERTVQLMDFANNSAGASNEQFGKTMESLEAKLNKLKNAWNEFLMGIMNDSWTKAIVDGTTTAIDKLNSLINLLSGGGKLKGVKSFLSLFTAFMGLRFAGGLANFGIGKLGKLVDPTAKRGALNLGETKGIAGKITAPIVAKLNELIAVTKGQKTSDRAISSTLAGYKNAANLLRMPQTMGTTRSTFGQLSDEHAYAAYINSPGTASAMKHTAMQWLNAKQLGPEAQKTGEQLMNSIFKGMERKQIPIKKGTKLIGKPELWGEYLGTETAKSFSDNFIKIQKTREAQQVKQIADARKQAWAQAGGDPYASDALKELQYKTNADGIKDRYLQAYKQIRQQQKEAFGGSLNTKAVDPKPYEQLANRVGTLGSNFTAAGYSMQMFGAQLGQLSPGLTDVGNLISRLGIAVSTFGMGFSGMGNVVTKVGAQITKGIEAAHLVKYGDTIGALINSGQVAAGGMIASAGAKAASASGAQVAGGFVSGFLNGIPKPLLVAGLIAAVGGAILAIHKHIEKQAQEAGKKVRESFENNFTKADEKINSLEEYKNRFNELSKGVDQFGHNINLSAEEYDEYLNISKELQQLSPSLIAGYNAEGEAIIKKGNAVQEVIDGLKKAKQEELDLFTASSSVNKLIGEYKTSDAYKTYSKTTRGKDDTIVNAFNAERNKIASLDDSKLNFKLVDSVNQLTGWDLNSLNDLTTSQLSWLSKHYSDVIGLVEEQNGKLSDEVKDGYIDAFANAGSAIDEVMTEGQPIIDAMQMWMGAEGIDAIGLGLGEEFGNSFNQGLEGIMLTGLSEGWSADTFKSNIRDYANEWEVLAGSTSEYADIMENAKDIQDEYLDSMGSDTAIQDYNRDITDSCNKLIELANSTDTATEAGKAFQQQCIAQANALRNYATEGGMALSQALNTAVDDITQAESALENFNEATKTDLYTAAEGMKSIYDKAFETYKDSFGGEYEKHFEGKGDRTAWEAGRSILSEDILESIPDGQALQKKLKEWEPALREGEEGWYNFWTKITDDSQLMENLNAIDGVHWDENDFYIPEDKWDEVAKTIGISEEMLTSMLNKGRQFADIDFTNWAEARHSLETSNIGIEGTVGTEKNGQRKLFIKEESFEAALADANYKPEEYEDKKAEAREQQNLEFLKAASEYQTQELHTLFKDEMGIGNLTDLISSLYGTGDYTKEEIEAYAEKAGFQGDFDSIYDKIAEAVENPELYKQTSVLEKISSQIALLSADSTISADDALKDRNTFAKELYGVLGKIDSEADFFAHGQTKEGDRLTTEQYEATKQSLEAQKAWAEQQASIAEARAANAANAGNAEEQAQWLEIANKYSQDAANLETYISMGIAAFQASEQEKSALIQQATDNAKELAASNASNDEIKASIQDAANKMAEAKMQPEEIAAALNKSYGTHLEGKDVNIGEGGKVDLTLDQDKLQQQLSNLHADVEANITGISVGGYAARASGQNNSNSMFHRHGTMAKGSRHGYIVPGRPTLTGEEGEELVWEPKRNQAYMVGSNGPQFANISKDAVVWNAAQTKRIKKNSKVGSFGTGAKGISRFGTMAGGSKGGLKIPGLLEVDAKANIQETVPPLEKPTIPVKAQFENTNEASEINATATVTKVIKSGKIAGEPISVQATATTTKVKNDAPKESAGTQTMNVTANTSAAQAQINKLISVFNKTYTLKYKASGPTSISVPISANFTGSWKKTVEINKSGARGINNHISTHLKPSFGSAAKGRYGTIGPKNKGGLTLTGEKGFEIAWLPNENRSMILGANGPQMLKLPSDAVVYTHEQSKQILKQKSIPAGSHSAESRGNYDASASRYANGGTSNSPGKQIVKNAKDAGDKVAKSAQDTEKAINRVLVWWDNAARRATEIQRQTDKNQKQYEKYLKEMQATLKTTATTGQGDNFIANTQKLIQEQQIQYSKAIAELNALDLGGAASTNKGRKNQYAAGADNIVEISYKKGKKTKTAYMNTADYIYQDANGAYQINQAALNSVKNADQRKALADALNKEINDRISKRNAAEDAIEKAQEALEKFAEELYKTFFAWEVELTKIWNLTKRIEATENNISRIKTYEETLNKQISTGLGKSSDLGRVAQTMQLFRQGLEESTNKLNTQVSLIEEQKKALQDAISIEDERATLASVQAKLNQRQALDNITAQKSNTLNVARANLASTQQQAAAKQAQIADLKAKKKKASTSSKKKKIQKQIDAAQVELNTINSYINYYAAQVNQATAEYNQAVANATANLSNTEKLAYEQYAKSLQDKIQTQTTAQKYLSIRSLADGTVEVSFDTTKFEEDKLQGLFTEEQGKAIQDYVKSIEETSSNLSDAYKNANTTVNELYDQLEQLENEWVGYANELWDIHDKEAKAEIDNLKKLSDSISKALKDLLDEVKRKIDERRQQEENAKTERDISQKQQRLAALRANTAGGNQVAIAQLEKEIAEAQQNYQQSLEDQLLDKLQEQTDIAEQQRARQIELQEAIAESVNNAALVDLWMSDPTAYRDEIYEAYKAANDYDKKPEALRDDIDKNFESLMLGLTTNQDKQEAIVDTIDGIQSTIDQIAQSLLLLTTDITNAKSNGLTVDQAQTLLNASYSDLRNQGGYTAEDFAKSEVEYSKARQAFSAEELKSNSYYAKDAQTEIVNKAQSDLDKAWSSYYYSNKNTVDAFEQAKANAESVGIDTSTYDVAAKIQTQKDAEVRAAQAAAAAAAAAHQAAVNAYVNKVAQAASNKKMGGPEFQSVLNYASAAGVSATQVGIDLARTSGLTWKQVVKAAKKAGYSKTVATAWWGTVSDKSKAALKDWSSYKTGGLADYTGPAWLDGTPSKPELVLNAKDTANFIALKDVLSKAMGSTKSINNSYGGDNIFEININVDKIEKDYDVDRVADRVKKKILESSSYRNVTQVRNFR